MNPNPNRRMSSIARKIHRASWRRLFRAFVLFDLLVAVLAVAGFCYATEQVAPGGFSPDTVKGFAVADGAFDWLDDLDGNAYEKARASFDSSRWKAALQTATYRFEDVYGDGHEASMGAFLQVFGVMFRNLLICQGVYLVLNRLFGGGGSRRILKPLTRMSQSAQQLSESKRPERRAEASDRLHNLEHAIGSIEPSQGARLSTGNEELKGLEQAVNQLLDRMQMAYREQSRFVSDASHELRTPIAVIQGYASMLDRWGKTDETVLNESIAAIKSESEHMKVLVEQLLFLARGDSGKQAMAFEPFDLAATMHEVFEESEMIDGEHDWRLDAPDPVPCTGDEAMLKQVMRILADNAAKYTAKGGAISLRAYATDDACVFSVQDSGQGIPVGDVPHIFERFYRADPARTGADKSGDTRSSGTGLGLPIAEWIIKRHGGYFEVISRPSLGSRFTAFIPNRHPAQG